MGTPMECPWFRTKQATTWPSHSGTLSSTPLYSSSRATRQPSLSLPIHNPSRGIHRLRKDILRLSRLTHREASRDKEGISQCTTPEIHSLLTIQSRLFSKSILAKKCSLEGYYKIIFSVKKNTD